MDLKLKGYSMVKMKIHQVRWIYNHDDILAIQCAMSGGI